MELIGLLLISLPALAVIGLIACFGFSIMWKYGGQIILGLISFAIVGFFVLLFLAVTVVYVVPGVKAFKEGYKQGTSQHQTR